MPNRKPPKSVTPRQPWVEAFRSGKHIDSFGVSHEYSEADIDTMAAKINAQVAGGFVPPIVLGHPESDSPRKGGVFEARTVGSEPRVLFLRADELVPEFAEAVQEGAYKYCSIAHYPDLSLRHLGVLGAANPAVKGMAPLAFGEGMFAEADQGRTQEEIRQFTEPMPVMSAVRLAFARITWTIQDIGRAFAALRDSEIAEMGDVEKADKVLPGYLIASLSGFDLTELADALIQPPEEPSAPAFADPGAPAPSALEAENARLRAALDAQAVEAGKRRFSERLDQLQGQGRLLPAQRPAFEALHGRLSGAGAQYAESEPAFAELEALLGSLPVQVQFNETVAPSIPSSINPLCAEADSRRESAAR